MLDDDGRFDELVVLAACVRRFQRGHCVGRRELRLRFGDRAIGDFDTIPTLIAIHRVITAGYRGDPCVTGFRTHLRELAQTGLGRAWRRVAAIQERMHGNARHTLALGQLEHRENVLFVAVHAAGRKQSHHMQRAVARRYRVAGFAEFAIFEKRTIRNRRVDAGQILIDDAASADVHVPDFGVAHLSIRQADKLALGVHQRVWAVGEQAPPVRRIRLGDRVVGGLLAMAPAVEDQQQHGFGSMTFGTHGRLAGGAVWLRG